jgi:DNA modification methylase
MTCKACGGTGKNSKGGDCVPCKSGNINVTSPPPLSKDGPQSLSSKSGGGVIKKTFRGVATILIGDCVDCMKTLPDKSIQCVVTSPPYFLLRDYGIEGQIGLEPTLEEFIGKLVDVFAEVHRILRDDGILWVNMGDSRAQQQGKGFNANKNRLDESNKNIRPATSNSDHQGEIWKEEGRKDGFRNSKRYQGQQRRGVAGTGLPPKSILGVPWKLAFALQEWGWILRQDLIWYKRNSMPESVKDRFTLAHEYIFMFAKRPKYYFDQEAVKEPSVDPESYSGGRKRNKFTQENKDGNETKIRRSVWDIVTHAEPESHFATFPPALVEIPIKCSTSQKGACAECGSPHKRILNKDRQPTRPGKKNKEDKTGKANRDKHRHVTTTRTIGWEKTCDCATDDVVPCIVGDPFSGSFTTIAEAVRLGRVGIGCELNPEYAKIGAKKIKKAHSKKGFGVFQ